MKAFLIESLNNFKLLQMKEKAKKLKRNDNSDNIINKTKIKGIGDWGLAQSPIPIKIKKL